MELHQTLKKVTQQSLTLQDCKFFLSKTGEKESKILYDNYCRKYHPKNSSLSYYFNRKLLEHIRSSPKLKKNSFSCSQGENSLPVLPLIRKDKKIVLGDRWQSLIRMTQKQNIVRKGCSFPRMPVKKEII